MRLRTFLIIILVVVIVGGGGLFAFLALTDNLPFGNGDDAPVATTSNDAGSAVVDNTPADNGEVEGNGASAPARQDEAPVDTTPRFVPVVVARVDLPAGSVIRPSLMETELRPADNVAVRAGYAFNDPADLTDRIVGTDIRRGQEILADMLADNPTDLTPFGTDLALYLEPGDVAVAVPIDRYSGIAYATRPGDRVDMLMTMSFVEVDEEFQSELPNVVQEVDQNAIAEGRDFLFPPVPAGRLELIPLINQVAYIGPSGEAEPVLRPVTQLTLQQLEVLWVGTWRETEAQVLIDPARVRFETEPDMLILGMTAQDALTLKWALEAGLDIDLALRAQGDETNFITTSVSLPQIVEQTGVTIPDQGTLRLEPPITEVDPPSLPDTPPGGETPENAPEQPPATTEGEE